MHRGKSPTVKKGPYKGQELSVDHIVPRAVVPELDNVIANLELLPMRLNESKNDKIGDRQKSHAKRFYPDNPSGVPGFTFKAISLASSGHR